jgi:PleD family two-component response regulator
MNLASQSFELGSKVNRKLRCLVANDDECQLYMMEVILNLNNFEVVKAQNGFEAFEKAAQAMLFTQ